MKRFFKIFLIILLTFFSLGLESNQAAYTTVNDIQNSVYHSVSQTKENILLNAIHNQDIAIVSANNNGYEIYSCKNNPEHENCIIGNIALSNNYSKYNSKYYLYSLQNFNSKNITPFLENEIFTRAP